MSEKSKTIIASILLFLLIMTCIVLLFATPGSWPGE